MPCHERFDARSDLQTVAGAVEDAIVTDPRLKMVLLLAQATGSASRSSAATVWPRPVMSSFSPSMAMRAQRWIAFRSTGRPRCRIIALGSRWSMNTVSTRLEVILGRQVHDGQILVIELPVLFRRVAIALNQMFEHLPMG